jgi:hypothetical protein
MAGAHERRTGTALTSDARPDAVGVAGTRRGAPRGIGPLHGPVVLFPDNSIANGARQPSNLPNQFRSNGARGPRAERVTKLSQICSKARQLHPGSTVLGGHRPRKPSPESSQPDVDAERKAS